LTPRPGGLPARDIGGFDRALAQARSALASGDFSRAAQIAEQVGRADPQAAEAFLILGMALAETGHVGHAHMPPGPQNQATELLQEGFPHPTLPACTGGNNLQKCCW